MNQPILRPGEAARLLLGWAVIDDEVRLSIRNPNREDAKISRHFAQISDAAIWAVSLREAVPADPAAEHHIDIDCDCGCPRSLNFHAPAGDLRRWLDTLDMTISQAAAAIMRSAIQTRLRGEAAVLDADLAEHGSRRVRRAIETNRVTRPGSTS